MTSSARATAFPCPSWCTLPAGHGFDDKDAGDPATVSRWHHREPLMVDLTEAGWHGALAVQIECLETARHEQVVERTPMRIGLYGFHSVDELTGPQAREVAAALLDAADEWDRVSAP